MPDSKKLLVLFLLIAIALCALPFIMAWPAGLSGLAIASGSLFALNHPILAVSTLAAGFLAAFLTRDGVVLIPVCYLLMYTFASMLMLGADAYPYFHLFIFGTILLFGITLMLAGQRAHLVLALIISSLAFHLGVHYSGNFGTSGQPLYYLVGEVIAISLMLSVSVSFGLIVSDLILRWLLPEPSLPNEYDA